MRELAFWTMAFLVSALIAIPQGGMLTPKFMQDKLDYSGVVSVDYNSDSRRAAIGISPGVPFKFGITHGQTPIIDQLIKYKDNWRENLTPVIWFGELSFYTSLRVCFFPIIGLLALWFMSKKEEGNLEFAPNISAPSYKSLAILGGYTFIIGFLIASTITLHGHKWELSRFMTPGMAIGMLGFSLFLLAYLKQNKNFLICFVLILIFVTSSPIIHFINELFINGLSMMARSTTANDIQIFLGQGPDIDRSLCVRPK